MGIMVILVVFVTTTYGIEMDCSDTTKQCVSLGSASLMYERLSFMTSLPTRVNPTAGLHQGPATLGGQMNRQGSYLTIMSPDGLSFGIINIIGNALNVALTAGDAGNGPVPP